ncbi:hypothetical protein ACIRD3_37135 [Kitasatospora sp. NPDC093550]|uniref:hypothetical protein n=1 Tax=Kitasatospora sp. NPDC093550 TaxID=3364089 RepID=UPI00381C4626
MALRAVLVPAAADVDDAVAPVPDRVHHRARVRPRRNRHGRTPDSGLWDRLLPALQAPATALDATSGKRAEAELQLTDGTWQLTATDSALAQETAQTLAAAVGPAEEHEALPRIERLAALREALAALALAVARTHGPLAWFLADASSRLAPVLHWRALDAPGGRSFGTVLPAEDELADAEAAIRLLTDALTRTSHD